MIHVLTIFLSLAWLAYSYLSGLGNSFNTHNTYHGSILGFSYGELSILFPIVLLTTAVLFLLGNIFTDMPQGSKNTITIIWFIIFAVFVATLIFMGQRDSKARETAVQTERATMFAVFDGLSRDYISTPPGENGFSEEFLSIDKRNCLLNVLYTPNNLGSIINNEGIVTGNIITVYSSDSNLLVLKEMYEKYLDTNGNTIYDNFEIIVDKNFDLNKCTPLL